MYIVVIDKNTTYLAYTNADVLVDMNPQDMILKDNAIVWKISGLKGWYAACGRFFVETDVLRYSKGLFKKEITYQSLLSHTVPKMKEILEARGLVKDRCWYNELLIASKDKAYIIDGYFCVNEVTDFNIADSREDIVRGCMEFNKDMPVRNRICEGLHSLEEMRGRNRFPAVVLDIATGKNETWWSYDDALIKIRGDWSDEMDELYKRALQLVIEEQGVSMSLLQRKLSIGYNKAGMLIERMEEENYIEEFKGGASRKVLITQAQFDERFHG